MARGARGVTCCECGCLNFNSEHEVCDQCRSKTLSFRSGARPHSSSGALNTKSCHDAASRAHSLGKKRNHMETKNTPHEDKVKQNVAKRLPDVIDLISDEDDMGMQRLRARRGGEKEKDDGTSLFLSRVFPSVTFVDSHFPSVEAVATMRKQAAERLSAMSQRMGEKATVTTMIARKAMPSPRSTLKVLHSTQTKVELGVSVFSGGKQGEDTLMMMGKGGNADVAALMNNAAAGTQRIKREMMQIDGKQENQPFLSRVFDSIEFQVSDYTTAFDGLAVARRSYPLNVKSTTSNKAPITIAESSAAPDSGGHNTNDVMEPVKVAMVASSTGTSAAPGTTTKTTPVARSPVSLPSESVASKASTPTRAVVTPANSSPVAPNASASISKLKASVVLVPAPAPTTGKPSVVEAPTKRKPSAMEAPTKATSSAVEAPSKVSATPPASLPIQANLTPSLQVHFTAPATSSQPKLEAVKEKPAASASSTVKPPPTTATKAVHETTPMPSPTSVTNAAITKVSSAPTTSGDRAEVTNNGKKLSLKTEGSEEAERLDEKLRSQKPSPNSMDTSLDEDGILFVKVTAAPREMTPVERPVLGYCSPDFLEFMRECGGDEDDDEEDDPEEANRSLLKLLNVVDLTNLSDSEDSDTGSPSSTPLIGGLKKEAKQQALPSNERGEKGDQPVAYTKGSGTQYASVLDAERKRAQLEKVVCELCEEKGILSRLIRCPTCTKYYHKKCAKENGDENICWNCELGQMIDDSELDEEHAKHDSEYLAYLKAIRRSPEKGEDVETAVNEDQEDGQAVAEEDDEMTMSAEGEGNDNPFAEGSHAKSAGRRWQEFIGEATADINASYVEITKRITEELRDDEKRRIYSRGFVSRDEFEAQMTEVEEYYINEEARLQQLEREKALEAKKVAEAKKAPTEAEQAIIAKQPCGNGAIVDNTASMSEPVVDSKSTVPALPSATTISIDPPPPPPVASIVATTASMAMPSISLHPGVSISASQAIASRPPVPLTTITATSNTTPTAGAKPS